MTWREERRLLNKALKEIGKRIGQVDIKAGMSAVTPARKRNARRRKGVDANRKWRKKNPKSYKASLERRCEALQASRDNAPKSASWAKRLVQHAAIEQYFVCQTSP